TLCNSRLALSMDPKASRSAGPVDPARAFRRISNLEFGQCFQALQLTPSTVLSAGIAFLLPTHVENGGEMRQSSTIPNSRHDAGFQADASFSKRNEEVLPRPQLP